MKKFILIGVGVLIIGGVLLNLGSDADEKEEAKTTQSSAVKKEDPVPTDAGDLGDYHVVIKDFYLAQDYNGQNAGVVTYEFTNNSDENAMFMTSITSKVFQNGIALEKAIMGEEGYVDSMTEIQPGATLELKSAYELSDDASPVSVEVTELFSKRNKLTKEFTLQ